MGFNFAVSKQTDINFVQHGLAAREEYDELYIAFMQMKSGEVLLIDPTGTMPVLVETHLIRCALAHRCDVAGMSRPSVRRTKDGRIAVTRRGLHEVRNA